MSVHVLIMLGLLPLSAALLGYDCGSATMNVTTVSLTEVGECNIPLYNPKTEAVRIQLLQTTEFRNLPVIECKVEIDREIFYCGMHSHISTVLFGRVEYLYELSYRQCKQMHELGETRLFDNVIVDRLVKNGTTRRSIPLAGTTDYNGGCTGSTYTDPFGTWTSAVVNAKIRVTTFNYNAMVNPEDNKVVLRSGMRCDSATLQCTDHDGASVFWESVTTSDCGFDTYSVIYEGTSSFITGENGNPNVYSLTSKDITYALAETSSKRLCGYKVVSTEHPRLFVMLLDGGSEFPKKDKIDVNGMDMFAYINAKFVYVEKHTQTQLRQLYRDILVHRCELERAILQNALAFSTLKPDEFGFVLMKGPGYYTTIAGELAHIIKCVPVKVYLRKTPQCYQELPVTYQNQSYFLTPKSRSLVKRATEIECDGDLPVGYNIDGTWFHLVPDLVRAPSPGILQPQTKPTWDYKIPEYLATSGIYSSKDLDRLRDKLMFAAEKQAVLDTLAWGAAGQHVTRGTVTLRQLLDEDTLNHLAASTAERLWKGFVTFGSASAGIMMVLLLIKLFKMLVDTCVHGYALHELYGCGLYLLGAVWSSVANVLIHRGQSRRRPREQDAERGASTAAFSVITTQPSGQPPIHPQEQQMDYRVLGNLLKKTRRAELETSSTACPRPEARNGMANAPMATPVNVGNPTAILLDGIDQDLLGRLRRTSQHLSQERI